MTRNECEKSISEICEMCFKKHELEYGHQPINCAFREFDNEDCPTVKVLKDLMATKENYQDAIMRMYDFCIASNHPAQIREQFTQDLDFLAKLANEHFEEKTETNYEHFEDEIIKNCMWSFALVDGKPNQCSGVSCCNCGFSTGHGCREKIEEWLKSPYKKPTYKLSQSEFDLIQTYRDGNNDCKLSARRILRELKDKGYFKCVDYDTKVSDILANCEAIE